ncbi:class I SAM-dependent methyltransferase [Paenibacillus harenae]|uniref:SAM-dependent methyltransferase n=1 Tax=Paenibacillus harenae TaxID=306543 RepID=A0ABT9U853_PAEHA|nr:class I SAM-dependent methyltransferase [Paenibacillus harenae]MDQ0115822.1 SAM-dependent methyltransferase [Paenibacillus harenae]
MLQSLQAIQAYRQGEAVSPAQHPWLHYLASAEERIVNVERIHSLKELTNANPVLDYVERSLRILDSKALSYWMKDALEQVLAWSETAKSGTIKDRMRWQSEGVNIFVHNSGSAQLYERSLHGARDSGQAMIITLLIEAHGLIGQQIRGEIPQSEGAALLEIVDKGLLTAAELEQLLLQLNHCVIGAVAPELWEAVSVEVAERVRELVMERTPRREQIEDRLRRMRTVSIQRGETFDNIYHKLDQKYGIHELLEPLTEKTFWYAEPALQDFSLEHFVKTMAIVGRSEGLDDVRHISFERLMNAMYYDYRGEKKINVYKQRIIEKYMNELDWNIIREGFAVQGNPHLKYKLSQKDELQDTLFVEFEFSAAAEKLIAFCVEAEKSPMYERAVLLLYDLFELRRDKYDRFHNEEVYLSDMNQTADYKKIILDYVVGERVIDIGPGGGVLLDLIEERLPDKKPIGIDISTNVVEALNRKKQLGGHRWEVLQGDALNLKDYVEPGSINTVIFSSIIHELYSYVPYNGSKFNYDTVAATLRSAYDVLSEGGRIIIRDGIMTDPPEQMRILRFLQSDAMPCLERYSKDFAGRKIVFERLGDNEVRMPVNDAMEFLYTYTWGEEAYVHEVQEQFGYFTPNGYHDFIRLTLGSSARIITSSHYLQAGYTEALADKVQLYDEDGERVPLPDSTCFIVIEKCEGKE